MPLLVKPALPADVLSCLDQPELPAAGLVLRPWQPSDVGAVLTAFAQPDIQHWHMRSIDGRHEALEWISSWADRWQAGTDAGWALTDASDHVLGCASLRTLLPAAATAQVSYWTLPAARRTGAASRGAQAVTQWALQVLGLHRVYLVHSVANATSCRVAVRAGFVLEGTLRGYMLHADGWHDVHMHAQVSSRLS